MEEEPEEAQKAAWRLLVEEALSAADFYDHVWEKGDIVIWDNRCSYHQAAGDYPPEEERVHWRVSIKEKQTTSLASL